MKIATWNIGEIDDKFNKKLNINSYEYITNIINEEDIDVICFQEAITSSNNMPTISSYVKEHTDLKYYSEYELSPSHINIGSNMGITICSKYIIDNIEIIPLDNPKLTRTFKNNNKIFSYDKGFLNIKTNGFNIISGHCLAFYAFQKDIFDYIDIYIKLDDKFINTYLNNNKTIICGDFNYENIRDLFPKTLKYFKDLINIPTRKNKQLDHFLISNQLTVSYRKIFDEYFDHKLAIFEIK